MTTTHWINPEAMEPVLGTAESSADAERPSGQRLRLGLLDNTKDNAHKLLQLIAERVRQEFEADIVSRRKGNATLGAAAEILDELAAGTDCVLTAMAD
jgi:hypothetical protein